jgi:hypothetical protein
MAFHGSIEHSLRSSRVVPTGHEHNGPELVLVAPCRKHMAFAIGSSFAFGDLHNIRHAKQSQLANLPCAAILVREPSADELVVISARRLALSRLLKKCFVSRPTCWVAHRGVM